MKINGNSVIIKETESSDLKNLQNLWNNGEIMGAVGYPDGLDQTFAEMNNWFNSIQENEYLNHYVVLNKDKDFCGELFYRKNIKHNRAGLDIKFLPEARGQRLATEALQLFIDYIFENEDNIEAVWTEPAEENRPVRALYTRLGLEEKERPEDMQSCRSYWELAREDWQEVELTS